MNTLRCFVLATAVVLLGAEGHVLRAQEKADGKLLIEIPAAVQATITAEKGDGKVNGFRKVNEDDGTTYVVALTIEGKNYELFLDAAGRVMRKELDEEAAERKPLTVEALPAAIRKTVQRESSGATVGEISVREKTYTVSMTIGKRQYVMELDEQGKLIGKRYIGDADER